MSHVDYDEISIADRVKDALCGGGRSMFSIEEPNQRFLNVEESFAPPTYYTLIGRTLTSSCSLGILLYDYFTTDYANGLYWGYLTHWTYVVALSYLIVATIVSLKRDPFLRQPLDGDEVHFMIKVMWGLYAVAAPGQIIVIIMYWLTVVPDEGISGIKSVYTHGILGLIVLVDGLLFSKIPLRRKQLWLIEGYALLYTSWTLIHSYTGIGDGLENSGDDVLYGVINWEDKPKETAIVVSLLFLVGIPIVFLVLLLSSLRKRPLYLQDTSEEDPLIVSDIDT